VKASIAVKKDAPTILQLTSDDGKKKEVIDLYLTKIGNDYFASAEEAENDGVNHYYILAKYALQKDGTLKVWTPETEIFAQAVAAKTLKGTVRQPNLFKDVVLEDTSENIRQFFKQQGTKCFGKDTGMVIRRIPKAAPAKTGK
jgi:hypothetical protein